VKGIRFSIRSLLIIIAICAIGIVLTLAVRRQTLWLVGTTGTTASAHAANQILGDELRLPAAATDVTYYVDFGAAEAEFAVSEEDFLNWCRTKGWAVQSIESVSPYFEPMWLPSDSRPVVRGYHFSPPDGQGTFDADRSRACFWVSTFP
jgi:hypothetical protein